MLHGTCYILNKTCYICSILQITVIYVTKLLLFYVLVSVAQNTGFYTRLPTKEETSETIVRNLYGLFTHIHDSLQLKTLKSLNKS